MNKKIQYLKKENAELKRQLEERQKFNVDYSFHERIGNFMVYTNISICKIPQKSRQKKYDSKDAFICGLTDYLGDTGTLVGILLYEELNTCRC